MHGGCVLETRLHFCGQIVVSGMHGGKLRAAKRTARFVAWHLYRVQHIRECDHAVIRHVGVPTLAGVRQADRFAVLDNVGQEHDLGMFGVLAHARDMDLE